MIEFYAVNKILVFLINIIGAWLGFWVYLNNPKNKLNKIFFSMVFLMLLWVNFAYLARQVGPEEYDLSILFLKIAWFATPLFFVSLYFLVVGVLESANGYRQSEFLSKAVIIAGVLAALVAGFTDFIIAGRKYVDMLLRIVYGEGMFFFLGIILFLIIATLHPLLSRYFKILPKGKNKLRYFLTGVLVFYSANIIFNVIFPIFFDITRFYFLGDYSTIILLALIAYAIVKQNLFGIKIILTTLLVGFIAVLLASDIFIFTESPALQFFKGIALLIFLYLGRQLIRSVLREEDQLKKAEELARNLVQANDSLRELVEMKTGFLHIVSHQLRTPLAAMRGFISMWQEGDFDSYSPRKMADIRKRIGNNVERLNNLVNDMVAAMESEGGMKLAFMPVDVEDLLESNIELLKANYEKKKLYIHRIKADKKLPKIKADAKYLGSAFMNIIDNAEKYTKKGGLEIVFSREADKVKVTFADTGVGISPEDKKNLFRKFSRGKKSNLVNPNGSGLGLYIIKQIIKQHHGKIEFSSLGEGKGATFTVILPIEQPD